MDFLKHFPPDFKWGTASSAYQVEGAYNEDGKGASIWDTFSNIPGNTSHNETGNIACDQYHRFKEDIDLMHQLGIDSYRFSMSWPRIFPDGSPEHINPHGVSFYDEIVDYCRSLDIEPIITLFHWDLPQPLEDQGGWFNQQTIDYFVKYASWASEHFSNRVTCFCTINEPQIVANLGYHLGIHAPGKHMDKERTIMILHQLALAHAKATTAMRQVAKQRIRIGFASTGNLCYPVGAETSSVSVLPNCTPKAKDIEAARIATFTTNEESWGFCHQIFCDATLLGKAPDFSQIGIPEWTDCDELCVPVDFLGINVYNGHEIKATRDTELLNAGGSMNIASSMNNTVIPEFTERYSGFPRTALKWPVTPAVMNYGMQFLYERYHLPIFICENGLSCNDVVCLDGKVHDPNRIDFLTRYLSELSKAMDAGVEIGGYMHWSFTDNYEWHSGYDERFGIVYVDYPSQKRIPKDSFYWYRDFINEYKKR